MGQSLAIPRVIPEDWQRLDLIVSKIKMRLGSDSDSTFAGLTLTDLTASALVGTDASKTLESVTIGTGLDYTRPTLSLADPLVVPGKLTAGSFASPTDVTNVREYGFEIHYSGNNYNATAIRARAHAVTTDTTAQFQGGLFQAANNDNINVGVLNGLVAEAIGKATANAATITMMRGALVGAEWSAKDTVTDLRTLHVRTHTRDAATEGYISGTGYGIYIENEAVGGNGQALDAGIYFKGTNLAAGNKAFTYGIDFSGGTFASEEIKLVSGSVIGSNSIVFQPTTDSTTFFQMLDADGGTPIFNIDSTNERVGIGTNTPAVELDMAGGDIRFNSEGKIEFERSEGTVGPYIQGGASGGIEGLVLNGGNWGGGNITLQGEGSLIFESFNALVLSGHATLTSIAGGGNTLNFIANDYIRWDAGADGTLSYAFNWEINEISKMRMDANGNIGIGGEIAPETLTEWTHAQPYLILHNSTHEDTDGGRESRINFKGEQGVDPFEETTLARIEVSHDGTGADDKGKFVLFINDGNDGDAPTQALEIGSDLLATFAGNISAVGLTLSSIAAEGADVDKFLVDSTGVIKYRTGAQVLSDIGAQTQGPLLDSLNALGSGSAVATEIIVCLSDGSYAWQTGATARASLGLGTGSSPQFTGIELGHADDTTITRVSAGVIAVEGVTVMLVGGAPTAHLHDGDVLEHDGVNSSAGAFAFTTGGIVTFNEAITMSAGKDLTIPGHIIFNTDNSYIGFTTAKMTLDGTGGEVKFSGAVIGNSTALFEGASVTVGKASTLTGTIVLHDSNSANTITLTVPDITAGSLSFTLPPTDGANTNVLQTDGNGVLTWVAVSGAAHAMLDGATHSDSVADTISRGSLIYGNATPKWDELVKGAADTFLGSDGTDVSYRTAAQVMASLSGEAGAAFSFNTQNLTSVGTIGCGVVTGTSTAIFEGASVTIGKASTTTGTLVLHDSGSANTITLTVPDAIAGSLTFTLPPTDGDNTNILQTDGNGVLTWVAAGGADSEKVKIDVGATADYIGVAFSDGVLRTTTGLSYVDGGNFVTLGLSHLGFESLTSPTPNDRIPFWDESGSAFAWLSPSTGLAISTTSLGLNFGALGEEATPDVLDVVCIYDPTGGAHHKVPISNLVNSDVPTLVDSESNAMEKAHAYRTQCAGFVTAFMTTNNSDILKGFVDNSNNPAGAGQEVDRSTTSGASPSVSFFVGYESVTGIFFEITHSSQTPTITWTPLVAGGAAPIDQD